MNRCALLVWVLVASFVAGLVGAGEDPVQKDRKQMTGDWKIQSHEKDGKKTPDDQVAKTSVSINLDGKLLEQRDGKTTLEATLKINPGAKPKQVDLAHIDGEAKGQNMQGIYELTAET